VEYSVEEISSVKKKFAITVAPEEVDAALAGALALIKQNIQIAGFRKGKVPAAVVEKRFHDRIEKDARDNLINVHINDIVEKSGSQPVSPITMTGEDKPLQKGQPYSYTMEYEIMPVFDLPPYEGLEVEEEDSEVKPAQVERMLERLREGKAPLIPVDGTGPAKDKQIAVIDFEPFENGIPLENFKSSGVELEIGRGASLADFENLIKTIPVGHTGEGEIHFPDDFIAPDLAGKTVTMKVTVHAVKERRLPEADDAFAQDCGYENISDMREKLSKSAQAVMGRLCKAEAEKKLLDKLVKQTNFELPPHMIQVETYLLLTDYAERMERMGKSIAKTDADFERLKEETRPQGEARAREKILLLTIAKKENLEVTQEEVAREVFRGSQKMGVDFKEYFAKMQDSGMIFHLRNNMLCDKAMDLIYDRATITKIPQKTVEDLAKDSAECKDSEKTAEVCQPEAEESKS